MVPEIGCAERILFKDEFPIIVVQLAKPSYDVTSGNRFPSLHVCLRHPSGVRFYLWTEIDERP